MSGLLRALFIVFMGFNGLFAGQVFGYSFAGFLAGCLLGVLLIRLLAGALRLALIVAICAFSVQGLWIAHRLNTSDPQGSVEASSPQRF